MVGWDEMLDGGVGKSATIMAWHSLERGIKGATRGYDIVMSPDPPLYFDAYQGDENDEPLAIGGLTRLQDVYGFEPSPRALNPAIAKHIIGVQANLWTEYIADPSYLFYMLLPREMALSEIAWSQPERRDWLSFEKRTGPQYAWLALNQINFRIPNPTLSVTSTISDAQFSNVSPSVRTADLRVSNGDISVTMDTPVPDGTIHYTMDGTVPTAKSRVYLAPLRVTVREGSRVEITAVTTLRDGRTSTPTELIVHR
jgi:hexosaminidase